LSLHDRLARIFKAVDLKVVEALQECPLGEAIIACENQVGVQEGKRARGETNKDAVLVQQVVGMMRVIAFDCEQRFVEPSPAQAKAVLLGIRRTASKAQVQRAVRAMVKDCPKVMSEHASDALANALAGARMVN
jgi:Holliday junction resolvasome RuvABC endonuclease subunit